MELDFIPFNNEEAQATEAQKVLLIETPVKAGFPTPANDYEEKELDFNSLLVHNPYSTFCLRVRGESMSGAGINSGDILVVDKSLEPVNNDIVVASINGEFTLKRLAITSDKIILCPQNDEFEDIEITGTMELVIFGVVSSVIKQFRK